MRQHKQNILAVALFFAGMTAGTVLAGDMTNFGSGAFNEEDVVNALVPPETPPGYKTRSIRPVSRAISLEVHFEKDSDVLTEKAVEVLSILGKALNEDRLREFHFKVEGHTDATGEDGYNQGLSERRAAAVKKFLAHEYQVAPERLTVEGKGESDLLPGVAPDSASNRRVTIVNTGK